MKKSDLRSGMIVEIRDGTNYLVMLNPSCEGWELISIDSGDLVSLSSFNEDLTCKGTIREIDIVKVYKLGLFICDIITNTSVAMKHKKLIWERDEAQTEMTIAEIEAKLGVKNLKIIKEKENE